MHDGTMRIRTITALLFAALALPAGANVLYKSVDANGTVMFSDVPPPSGARVLETRVIAASTYAAQDAGAFAHGAAAGMQPADLEQVYSLMDSDRALAEANARVDQAERGLAMARNGAASRFEGLRLVSTARDSVADSERIEFYKRDLKLARRALVDLIRERQRAAMQPGAPRIIASNASGSLLGAVR
jgi:hypothetical protein